MPPETNITIRQMKGTDMPFIRRGLSETNWQDVPDDQKAVLDRAECDKRVRDDFDRFMKEPKYKFRVFIAQSGEGGQLGYISVGETCNPAVGLVFGAIFDFWVEPESRNGGVGGMLLEHAIKYLRSRGYTHICTLVSSRNQSAISLYGKNEFCPDRVYMVKPLKSPGREG
jgi:ribosomal protein S18 acetylase RimI-like enzyme